MPERISIPAKTINPNDRFDAAQTKKSRRNAQKSAAWATRNVRNAPPSSPANVPPPPPVSSDTGALVASSTKPAGTQHHEAHLEAIRQGITLRKSVPKQDTSPVTSANTKVQYRSAYAYITDGSWDNYKDKLTRMITESGGKPTSNQHLNHLMAAHARFANKTGVINAVVSDRDATGQLQKHERVSKSEYESYVLGREQKVDRNNDFKQTLNVFLDQYLHNLSAGAKKGKKSLKGRMQAWFGIATVVQTPRTFFMENEDLRKQLEKTGCNIEFLLPEDITEDFISGLIHYDTNPKRIDRLLENVFSRQKIKLLEAEAALERARNKHKATVMNVLGIR